MDKRSLLASRWAPASNATSELPANQPHYQQNNILQQNGTYHLNAAQVLQPAETSLQRYQTPRTMNVVPHHDQLLDMVQNHNIQQITEATRLDQNVRGLNRQLQTFYSTITNHMATLEKKVENLHSPQVSGSEQKQITASESAETQASKLAAEYEYYHTNVDGSPTEEMLANHPKEKLASSYLDEADQREASAVVLRQRALDLCPDILDEVAMAGHLRIESLSVGTQQSVKPDFSCCSTEFSAIGELVDHVERTHTAPEHRLHSRNKPVEVKSLQEEQVASVNGETSFPLERTLDEAAAKQANATQDTKQDQTNQDATTWTPIAVRDMPPAFAEIPSNTETFCFEFIRATLSGEYWSPGFYFVPKKSILPSKSYWILDLTHEPFLPTSPGQHGAKLTAFFNETVSRAGQAPSEDSYQNVPVFIKTTSKDEYSYFGNYSQLRFSDKLGYDTIAEHIPESVLRFHAEQLAETGRPAWITQALKEHFWPKPTYDGPIPTDSAINSPATSVEGGNTPASGLERRVTRALVEYADELKTWEKDSKFTVSLLTSDTIFKAFSSADTDSEPGLRLFWEYLQCVGWDYSFYNMLVGFKNSPTTKLEIGGAGKSRCQSPERKDGSTASKRGVPPPATFKARKPEQSMEVHPDPSARTKFVRPDFSDELVHSGAGKVVKKNATKTNGVPPAGPKGDLEAAKAFAQSVKKDDSGKAKSMAPHSRNKK